MSDNNKTVICIAVIALSVMSVSGLLIGAAFQYAGNTRKLQTIDNENIFKHCTQVDKHVDKYGGVVSYECNDKKETK